MFWMPEISEVDKDTGVNALYPPCSVSRRATCVALMVPGFMADGVAALVAPFMKATKVLSLEGYRVQMGWVSGRHGCNHNARVLRDTVLCASASSGKQIHLVGYSKGCADAMPMVVQYPQNYPGCLIVDIPSALTTFPLAQATSILVTTSLCIVSTPPLIGDK